MIVPSHVSRWHGERIDPCRVVRDTVRTLVEPYLTAQKYSIVDRIKTVESVAEKIETGRFVSLDVLDDFYAATIVVPSLQHEEGVLRFLRDTFREKAIKGRSRAFKDPEAVRFDATRFYGRLRPSELGRDPRIDEMLFEIQIQTAFEHAWVIVTHDTVFKANVVDWRRRRLASLLKATVEQVDLLLVGFESASSWIEQNRWEEYTHKTAVLALYQRLAADGRIPEEALPGAWSRFADNVFALCKAESQRRRAHVKEAVRDVTDAVAGQVAAEGWSYPRSVSLFQATFGIAADARAIGPPLPGYTAILNEELLALFPSTKLFV